MTATAVTMSARALARPAMLAASLCERRNTIPILGNALVRGGEEGIDLVVTDMDMTVTASIGRPPAAGTRAGWSTTAPAHALAAVIGRLPAGADIRIGPEEGGDWLSVAAPELKAETRFEALAVEDFPEMAEPQGGWRDGGTIAGAVLLRAIRRTLFAVSTEETRDYPNGIYLQAAADGVRMTATDGHRLASVRLDDTAGDLAALAAALRFACGMANGECGLIVPRKAWGFLARAVGPDDTVSIAAGKDRIRFAWPGYRFTSTVIDRTFPDWRRVVPAGNLVRFVLPTAEVDQARRLSVAVCGRENRGLKFEFEGTAVRVSNRAPGVGEVRASVPIEEGADRRGELGVNHAYLGEMIRALEAPRVVFRSSLETSGSAPGMFWASPMLFEGADPGDVFVQMPMRV